MLFIVYKGICSGLKCYSADLGLITESHVLDEHKSIFCWNSNQWVLSNYLNRYFSDPHDDGGLHGLLPQRRLQRRAFALQLLGQRPRRHLSGLRPGPAGRVAVHVQRRHLALDCHRRHCREHSGRGRGLCLHFLMNPSSSTHTYRLTHHAFSVSLDPQVRTRFVRHIVSLHLYLFLLALILGLQTL